MSPARRKAPPVVPALTLTVAHDQLFGDASILWLTVQPQFLFGCSHRLMSMVIAIPSEHGSILTTSCPALAELEGPSRVFDDKLFDKNRHLELSRVYAAQAVIWDWMFHLTTPRSLMLDCRLARGGLHRPKLIPTIKPYAGRRVLLHLAQLQAS